MTDRGEVNAGIDAKLKRMYDRRDAMRDGIDKRIAVENGLDPTDLLDLARAANAATKAIERWERLEIADPSLTPTRPFETQTKRYYDHCALIAAIEDTAEFGSQEQVQQYIRSLQPLTV